MSQTGFGSTARALVAVARSEQLGFLAAAIAYYAFVSLLPLLLLTVSLASAVAGPAFAARVLAVAEGILSPGAIGLLDAGLTSATGRSGATLFGLIVLAWGGLRVFRGLDLAFARIYKVNTEGSFLRTLIDAAVALIAIGLAVGTLVAGTVLLPVVGFAADGPLGAFWLIFGLPLVFLPLYYVFPDCPVTLREALPGAALAGFGWTALGIGFGVYAAKAADFQLYGVIGGVLLVLTWFYVGGLLVLSGAVLNTVLADRRDRQLQQGPLRDDGRVMTESDADDPADTDGITSGVSEPVDREEIAALRRELDRIESDIEDRTVRREDLESDLKRYVRRRQRRGYARGWGPYLVLLYGTIMTLGAFFFLNGGWAVLAMVIVWLSTLGLYTLMIIVGVTATAAGLPGRLRDTLETLRD